MNYPLHLEEKIKSLNQTIKIFSAVNSFLLTSLILISLFFNRIDESLWISTPVIVILGSISYYGYNALMKNLNLLAQAFLEISFRDLEILYGDLTAANSLIETVGIGQSMCEPTTSFIIDCFKSGSVEKSQYDTYKLFKKNIDNIHSEYLGELRGVK